MVDVTLPSVPSATKAKIAHRVFTIQIPGYPGAYNPSIVPFKNGFLLSFRYDDLQLDKSVVGLVRLDQGFKIVGDPVIADTTYEQQDVRLFWYDGKLFATGSRIISMSPPQCPIAISQIDLNTLKFTSVIDLDFHPQIVEKNWVPLVHTDSTGINNLYYVYYHNPLHILRLPSTDCGTIEHAVLSTENNDVAWERNWGKIRGGTPCLPIGDEQLAFFHSTHFEKNRWWWLIGAITFENKPPFRITKISPYPIMADGMYTTPFVRRFKKRTFRVAFPGGFVEVQKKGKSFFYLVYGENDSGIKVLVLNKENVLSSLKNFP